MERFEGSGVSKLKQAIRKYGYNEFDRYELATVTAPPPAIAIKVDNVPIVFDAADLIIAEHLTEHKRTVSIGGGEPVEMIVESPLQAGDRVIVASMSGGQAYVVVGKVGEVAPNGD